MINEKTVFKYSLEALLTKRNAELSIHVSERAGVESILQKKQAQYDEVVNIQNDAEAQLRAVMADGDGIAPGKVQTISAFIAQQREIAGRLEAELERVRAMSAQLLERIKRTRQSIKGLEKHKDRKARNQGKVLQRAGYREADGLWLLRRSGKIL